MTRFLYQYLDEEKLHYLVELHDEDGVMGEDFFETREDFLDYIKLNNIKYKDKLKSKNKKMKEIKDLTRGQLWHIADLATGGNFSSDFSKFYEEVGSHDNCRRVEWLQNTEGYNEEHYFEVCSEFSEGWSWHCEARYKGQWHPVNTVAPHRIVDYLRENGFNVENSVSNKE